MFICNLSIPKSNNGTLSGRLVTWYHQSREYQMSRDSEMLCMGMNSPLVFVKWNCQMYMTGRWNQWRFFASTVLWITNNNWMAKSPIPGTMLFMAYWRITFVHLTDITIWCNHVYNEQSTYYDEIIMTYILDWHTCCVSLLMHVEEVCDNNWQYFENVFFLKWMVALVDIIYGDGRYVWIFLEASDKIKKSGNGRHNREDYIY